MEAKHTPGPWRVDPHHCQDVQSADGREIAVTINETQVGDEWIIRGDGFAPMAEAEANARLIASAPTMADYISRRAAEGDKDAVAIMEAINAAS